MASKIASKQETSLQAVIICDNFGLPARALGSSWALLPLAGARIIDYTIEFLLKTSVDEVIIFSVFDTDKVEEYLKKRWISSGLASFRVTFMSSKSCRSVGDVMRDLDSKAIIKSDFLLTQAGFVSNDDLFGALSKHTSKRVKDKNAVLTLIYAECSVNHPARSRNSDEFLVLDTVTNRLLHCQNSTSALHDFEYPVEVLKLADEATTRFDLLDCNMAICSPQIPPLFSDNFDFQTRRHLVREILTNEEILGYRIFVDVLTEKYAAFIGDLNTYLAINRNILERWCFPVLPHVLNGNDDVVDRYSCRWPYIYISDNVKRIAKSARLDGGVLIGTNCEISEECHLVNVTMGENCTIGANAVLKNCILWSNVVVESDCFIENSILCDGSRLGSRSRLNGRCIVGRDVCVPSGAVIAAGTILSKIAAPADSGIKSENAAFVPNTFSWRLTQTAPADAPLAIWPAYVSLDTAEGLAAGRSSDESGDDKSDIEEGFQAATENAEGTAGLSGEDDYEIFYEEVLESLQRGFVKQIACDNLIMEINSSKHAYNVPVVELQRRVMTAILATTLNQNRLKTDTPADVVKSCQAVLSQLLPLINNYFKHKNHISSGSSTRSTCLEAIQDFVTANDRLTPALSQILYFLYDKDIVEEEVLLPWCNQLPEDLKNQVRSFIQWLEEAEEESSGSD